MSVRPEFRTLAVLACGFLLAPGAALAAKPPAKQPKPDLSISGMHVSGGTSAGARVKVAAGVLGGKLGAGASKTSFFLSTNAVRDKKDTQLAVVATPKIKPKKFVMASANVKLPATLTGSFYVIACADGPNKLAEANEKNNCKASSKQSVAAPPVVKPPKVVLPKIRMGATRPVAEGNTGSANMLEYDVVLSAASASDVTFDWSTSSVGTSSSNDYVASSGTATIPAGQTSTTLRVPVVGDTNNEDDETVRVVISNEVGADDGTSAESRADALIRDDDNTVITYRSAASSSTTVALDFSSAPTNLNADGSQFTIDDLEVTGATLVGKRVLLTTEEQFDETYTINIAGLEVGLRTVPATRAFRGIEAIE